jgi:hypothetical protein
MVTPGPARTKKFAFPAKNIYDEKHDAEKAPNTP